jgi:hypothetical protein
MSLRRAVAAPFRQRGVDAMTESEFVVALSLDRDWFSADQAKRLVNVAASEGLLDRREDEVGITFDPLSVAAPDEFEPDEEILQRRSTFERLLDELVDAGVEKQTAVAEINQLQAELAVSVEAAAALYCRRQDIDVTELARRARGEL